MRDVYYQSAGNPLQVEQLPASRPDVELLAPPLPTRQALAVVGRWLLWLLGVQLVALFCFWPPGLQLLEPFDLVIALSIIGGALALAIVTRSVRPLYHPLFVIAVVVVCLNHRVSYVAHVCLLAVASGFFVYSFGWHWSIVSTASPLPRETARRLRASWTNALRGASILAVLLVGGTLLWDSVLGGIALAALPLAAFLAPSPGANGWRRLDIIGAALRTWLTYEAEPVPGLAQSPVGTAGRRRLLTLACVVLVLLTVQRGNMHVWSVPTESAPHVAAERVSHNVREPLTNPLFVWLSGLGLVVAAPIGFLLVLTLSLTMPVLLEGAAQQRPAVTPENYAEFVADLRRSVDATERDSVYIGRVVADGSPVLVPLAVYREHAHFLGDSGSGKTSQGLCPQIEQLTRDGQCSLVCIDLKADSLELLATLQSAAEAVRREHGIAMPLKFFSNQAGRATFAFNPMTQPFWSRLDLLTRTDILCGALGLTYGTDYGQGFYSSANAGVLFHTLQTFPHVRSFTELGQAIGTVITTAKKKDIHTEIRKAGVHVHEVIKRLAACQALNVGPTSGHAPDTVEQSIDLTQLFREPQLLYFHLSATLSPSGAPEIGRLVTYLLLAAATQVERRHPVYLVVDEFQRMVASNIEYMLQLARSMGVGVILANQSMEDLRSSTIDLVPAIEANCRFRQWFSVSASSDQQRLIQSSGETVDYLMTTTHTSTVDKSSTSVSWQENVVKRLTMNDVLLASDHPFRSIVRISRGAGYAQYGGLPFVVESTYHISADEYRRRKALAWPTNVSGTFVPEQDLPTASTRPPVSPSTPNGTRWTEDVVDEGVLTEEASPNPGIIDPLESLLRGLEDWGAPEERSGSEEQDADEEPTS